MAWEKPEDCELIAECETLPEAEIVCGLLASAGIEATIQAASDSTIMFAQRSVFGETARPLPYKVLVLAEDAVEAKEIMAAPAEALDEEGNGNAPA